MPRLSSDLLAKRKPTSFRDAINMKCKECIYDPVGGDGTWRNQVDACTAVDCPLHVVRPRPTTRALKDGPAKDIPAGLKAYQERMKAQKEIERNEHESS